MNKFLLLLILPLLSLVMSGCDDNKDDVVAPDLTLLPALGRLFLRASRRFLDGMRFSIYHLAGLSKATEVIRDISIHIFLPLQALRNMTAFLLGPFARPNTVSHC